MPVTSADLLAAAIAPRLTFAPGNAARSPASGSTTPATASFDNVLASVQATSGSTGSEVTPGTTAPGTVTATTSSLSETGLTSLSTIGEEFLPETVIQSTPDDLASSLAVALANIVFAATPVDTPAVPATEILPASTTDGLRATGDRVPTPAPLIPTATRSPADLNRLSRSQGLPPAPVGAAAPNPVAIRSGTEQPDDAAQDPVPRAVPNPNAAANAVLTNVTLTAETPADTARAATRTPSVLAQSPIVVDRPTLLPGDTPFVPERPYEQSAPEIRAIEPVARSTPEDQPPVNLRPAIVLARESLALDVAPQPPGDEFVAEIRRLDPGVQALVNTPADVSSTIVPASASSADEFATIAENPIRATEEAWEQITNGYPNPRDVGAGTVPVAGEVRPPSVSAAPAATPSPAASPATQLADAMIGHASLAERDGKYEFQLRLDPPELGPVKVRLIAHGDRMSAEVVVSNDAIRSMIESQLPDLRQRLADIGLALPDVDVSTGRDGGRDPQVYDELEWQRPRTAPASTAPAVRATGTSGTQSGTVDITV